MTWWALYFFFAVLTQAFYAAIQGIDAYESRFKNRPIALFYASFATALLWPIFWSFILIYPLVRKK